METPSVDALLASLSATSPIVPLISFLFFWPTPELHLDKVGSGAGAAGGRGEFERVRTTRKRLIWVSKMKERDASSLYLSVELSLEGHDSRMKMLCDEVV